MKKLRVLILADDCNPDWPSLPLVGYKYALALGRICDVTVATHVRNRENIEIDAPTHLRLVYFDNEYIAAPMYKLALWLRGGDQVAWSTNMAMRYPSYLAFEREVWKEFGPALKAGDYDVVHRITPMSPTLPSPIAKRCPVPFVTGPLNGNLDWPVAFHKEQRREKEMLRKLRKFYRFLPYARSTYQHAALILASFEHTIRDLPTSARHRAVNFPEVGFDPQVFHVGDRVPAFSGPGPYRFAYFGRLVPYKVPEVAVRAFAFGGALTEHSLDIVGDGPERERLEKLVKNAGAEDRIRFLGRVSQSEVSRMMREIDGFVFPSIRELGAGVVVEAMASGAACFVTDYGAPGTLCAKGRGNLVPLGTLESLVEGYRDILEAAVRDPAAQTKIASTAKAYVDEVYKWDDKARLTLGYYEDLCARRPISDRGDYH